MNSPDLRLSISAPLMDTLWARIRENGDLPGFETSVHAIVSAMQDPDQGSSDLAQAVLSDMALTQRVIRLANSAMYCYAGGEVTTVSRAIVVLGTEAIGHVALGLKIISQLDATAPGQPPASVELDRAGLAGTIVRELTSEIRSRDAEEAVVCALMHRLGRILVAAYVPEHLAALEAAEELNDPAFYSYTGIGQAVARKWGLPEPIVRSLNGYVPQADGPAPSHEEWLSAVSSFSNRAADAEGNEEALAELACTYSAALGIAKEALLQGVSSASEQRAEIRPASTMRALSESRLARLEAGFAEIGRLPADTAVGQVISTALEAIYSALGLQRALAFVHLPRQQQFVAKLCLGAKLKNLAAGPLVLTDAFAPDVAHVAMQNDRVVLISNVKSANISSRIPSWWPQHMGDASGFLVVPLSTGKAKIGFLYLDWTDLGVTSDEVRLLGKMREAILSAIRRKAQAPAPAKIAA